MELMIQLAEQIRIPIKAMMVNLISDLRGPQLALATKAAMTGTACIIPT
jgi:hypothetical protein